MEKTSQELEKSVFELIREITLFGMKQQEAAEDDEHIYLRH